MKNFYISIKNEPSYQCVLDWLNERCSEKETFLLGHLTHTGLDINGSLFWCDFKDNSITNTEDELTLSQFKQQILKQTDMSEGSIYNTDGTLKGHYDEPRTVTVGEQPKQEHTIDGHLYRLVEPQLNSDIIVGEVDLKEQASSEVSFMITDSEGNKTMVTGEELAAGLTKATPLKD